MGSARMPKATSFPLSSMECVYLERAFASMLTRLMDTEEGVFQAVSDASVALDLILNAANISSSTLNSSEEETEGRRIASICKLATQLDHPLLTNETHNQIDV